MMRRKRRLAVGLAMAALVMLAAAAFYQWRSRFSADPEQLFAAALASGMTQTGVTCTIEQSGGTPSSRQRIELDLKEQGRARALVTVRDDTQRVTTEEIVVPGHDYIRYTEFKNGGQDDSGMKADFSKVLGIWTEKIPPETLGLFAKAAMSDCVVPLADLQPGKAESLVGAARRDNVFAVQAGSGNVQRLQGKNLRVYEVKIRPETYVGFMRRAAQAYGLKDLDSLSAAAFKGRAEAPLKMYVDTATGRFSRIEDGKNSRTITFSAYGTRPDFTPPRHVITAEELSKRIMP